MISSLLHELEVWAKLKDRPIWIDRLVSELGVERTLELAKAIKFNEENKEALEFVENILTQENIRRIEFLM